MAFVDVGDARLFFTDDGAGVAVLLIHGGSCDSHDWSYLIPALVPRYRVVAVDLRGHGRSSIPEHGYDPRSHANDLVRVLDSIGVERVVAVGHSLGGAVATALAVEHAERVAAVVVVDGAYGARSELRPAILGRIAAMEARQAVEHAKELINSALSPATAPHLRTWYLRRIEGMPPHVLAQTHAGTWAAAYQFSFRPEAEEYLRRRRCPVLSVGRDPERMEWERNLLSHPQSRAVCWEGVGHWLHHERPHDFANLVVEWLHSLDAR